MTALLIDDDETLRAVVRQALELEDIAVEVHADPLAALERLTPGFDGAVVTDVRMPGIDGFELFKRVQAIDPDIPVIVTTGHADVPMVLDALKRGVFDFIPKPFATDHLIASVRRGIERRALILENRALRALAARAEAGDALIGETAVMAELRDRMRRVALAEIDVLVEGETGVGKELVALLLHRWGPRRGKPFVAVNCAALPPGLAEAELFGYAPGVHTHYRGGQPGRIAMANGGTLFLDEVGSMPLSVQGAFLRVIEEREVMAIGGERPTSIDLRIVAATNIDLAAAVEDGRLRKDLYYRLNPVQLRVPPLRERMPDVPLLFAFFLEEAAARNGRPVAQVDRDVHAFIQSHDWPGNARELRSYAQRVALGLHRGGADDGPPVDLNSQVADFEAGLIRAALTHCSGDIAATLARLGIARNTLYDKLKRYRIKPADFRG
jgi:two-component system C4-dicarboxylate transport response regulator DctD